LRIFLDCPSCDSEFIRTEINFTEFVRDRTAADVHILVTVQATGGGGREHALNFIGRGRFDGVADTIHYTSPRDHTPDQIRRELSNVIRVGLMRYIAATTLAPSITISLAQAPRRAGSAQTLTRDPWNYWVFSVSSNGNADGESQFKNIGFSGSVSANRVTAALKLSFSMNGSYREQTFEFPGEPATKSFRKSYSTQASMVRSVGPHFSVGLESAASSNTFGNQKLSLRGGPVAEYDIFPYSESTRRMFTITYNAGVSSFDYRETTIYGVTAETRGSHGLSVAYTTRQPWGSAAFSVNGSQFLHDTDKYRASVSGNASIRLFGGLSLNVFGQYSKVNDQLSLPAGTLTRDEILLRQKQLATNYFYYSSVGLTYRFGSVFSTVVNPRIRRFAGEEFFF
jgi:hypothetical protein